MWRTQAGVGGDQGGVLSSCFRAERRTCSGKTRQCRAWLNDSSEPHPGTQQEIRLGSSAGVEGDALCYSFMMRKLQT